MLDIAIEKTNLPVSVYAEAPHVSRSANYSHVPTTNIVEWLGLEGFVPVSASQAKVRKADREGFQKHIVRFRQRGAVADKNGLFSEIILRNAHDGTGAVQVWAGLLRLLCLNGMAVSDSTFQNISIPHRGRNLADRILEAAHHVASVSIMAGETANAWSQIELNYDNRFELARRALALRFPDIADSPIAPEQLLLVRRSGDAGNDAWRVFNRIQENLTRGGLVGLNKKDEKGAPKIRTLRAIRGADRDLKLNGELWHIADEFIREAA